VTRHQFQRSEPSNVNAGWEPVVFVLAAVAAVVAIAALLGLAGASALWGHGWVWPKGPAVEKTLGGLLTAHPGRGLPPAEAAKVPGAHLVYGCVAAAEVVTLGLAAAAGLSYTRNRRPGDTRGGMATRREAAKVLGVDRLRQAKAVIRPDLHGKTDARQDV
jgi:hypothetical protein